MRVLLTTRFGERAETGAWRGHGRTERCHPTIVGAAPRRGLGSRRSFERVDLRDDFQCAERAQRSGGPRCLPHHARCAVGFHGGFWVLSGRPRPRAAGAAEHGGTFGACSRPADSGQSHFASG